MEDLEWVTNELKEYRPVYICDGKDKPRPDMTKHEWLKWRSQFVQGPPMPPPGSKCSIGDLQRIGLEGWYRRL
jgi:hypothetical protein